MLKEHAHTPSPARCTVIHTWKAYLFFMTRGFPALGASRLLHLRLMSLHYIKKVKVTLKAVYWYSFNCARLNLPQSFCMRIKKRFIIEYNQNSHDIINIQNDKPFPFLRRCLAITTLSTRTRSEKGYIHVVSPVSARVVHRWHPLFPFLLIEHKDFSDRLKPIPRWNVHWYLLVLISKRKLEKYT